MTLRILQIGWSTSIQDAGRWGWAHLGVSPSGVVDPALAGLMNRLVGNPSDAAVLETAGGLRVQAVQPVTIASSDTGVVRSLTAGEQVHIASTTERNFEYLAVRGGLAVSPVLGSCSQDLSSAVGPSPLAPDMCLGVGPDPRTAVTVDHAVWRASTTPIQLWPGPELALFTEEIWTILTTEPWTPVAPINRIGIRLSGPTLPTPETDQRRSEGLIPGAVQVPPDGQPIVLLRDHPTTGGYPVVAVVDPTDLGRLAQTPSGQPLRFIAAHSDAI